MKKYLLAFLFLPGTFLHELSHFLMAKILFVSVGRFNLIPKRVGDMFQLGSVMIAKTDLIRESLIGIAPFFVGVGLIFYILKFNLTPLSIYFLFQVFHSMFLSFSDVKAILKLIFIILVIVLVGNYFIVSGIVPSK